MTSIRDSQPYALIVNQNLDKANNMSFPKAIGEVAVDNSFDANGNAFIATISTANENFLLFFNDGENLTDLTILRGLSETLTGKAEDKIGIMNRGYLASECFFAPDRVINMSRDENGDPMVLSYKSGQHYKDIKAARDNLADGKLIPQKYMTHGILDLKVQPMLKELFQKIQNPMIQKKLLGALEMSPSKGTSQYFLTLWGFNSGHKLFSTLDEQLKSCVRNFNFYHGLILKEGVRTITCEYSNGKQEVLNRTTAHDLHWGSSKLRADCQVFIGTSEITDTENKKKEVETIILEITLSMDGFPGSDMLWITNQPSNNQFKGTQPLYAKPQILRDGKLKNRGSFEAFLSVLSDNEADAQIKAFGGDFDKVDKLRGLFNAWNKRYLGNAWWDSSWGASRNAGQIRAEIRITKNRFLIQKLFNIQADKSQMSFDEIPAVTHRFLLHFLSNPIKTIFTSQKKTKQEKDDHDFKYQWAWNPTQMFQVIKYGELTAEMAAHRKNLLDGIVPVAPAAPTPPKPVAPAPAAPKPVAPPSVVAQLVVPAAPKPAPSNPVIQPKKEKARTPSPEMRPAPSKTPVGPFERSTSKSPQDLMKEVMDFAEAVLNSNIQDVFDTASNTTQKGLVEHVNALQAIKKNLATLGVKFDT